MKKYFTSCVFGLILIVNHSFSQSDKQWMIWNGLGKDGVTPSGTNNNYVGTNSIANEFTLYSVVAPNPGIPEARNDIFIIYGNGEHFNTKEHTGRGPIYGVDADYPTVTSHRIKTSNQGGVKYMYLTNRYEGDDLPSGVKAMAVDNPPAQNTYPQVDITRSLVSVNHTIVRDKDITVIANFDSIPGPNPVVLSFSYIEPIGGGTPIYGNFLDLKPVFGSSTTDLRQAVYPIPGVNPGTGESITLQPANGRYRYVNFRPTQLIGSFLPAEKGAPPHHQAVFKLSKGGTPIGQAVAPLGLAHDPNFLRVESICKQSDGSYIISYHLEYENDGDGFAEAIKAEVFFPPQFIMNCMNAHHWFAAGNVRFGTTLVENNKVTFNFGNGIHLGFTSQHPTTSSGFVRFKVKVDPTYNVSDVNNSIRPDSIFVYFDNNPFPLNEFRDLLDCKVVNADSNALASILADPNIASNLKKDYEASKQDTLDKEKALKAKKYQQDYGIIKTLKCNRPITPGKCKCREGGVCLPCIWVGAAILLTGIVLYTLRRRKKPTPPPGK